MLKPTRQRGRRMTVSLAAFGLAIGAWAVPAQLAMANPADSEPQGGYVPRLYGQQAIEAAIHRGLTQVGRIYSWGGGSAYGPTRGVHDGGVADRYGDYMHSGYDCSGLMVFSYAAAGIMLPKYSGDQYHAGRQVPDDEMRRGDLIFYGPDGNEHVALYLGSGMMLESPESGERVHVVPVRAEGLAPYVVRLF